MGETDIFSIDCRQFNVLTKILVGELSEDSNLFSWIELNHE